MNDKVSSDELRHVTEICERAAQGDLEARIIGIDPASEFGRLCGAINHMLDIGDSFVREASAAMDSCSHDRFHRPILLPGLTGAYRKSAATINRAGVKMRRSSERLDATARLAAETATNLNTVAAACEELNATNAEISRQVAASATDTECAVSRAGLASDAVRGLSDAVHKIEAITTFINRIAGQTNLLALNAMIEAARAGEHGSGFAVVANEVKELARSSAKATEDIERHIKTMQTRTGDVVKFIDSVSESIEHIHLGAGNIANSVREQLQANDDITRNITHVSHATNKIAANMNSAAA